MVRHVRVDYLTIGDDRIEELTDVARQCDETIVLQQPLYTAYPLVADEVREKFERLKTALEETGADVRVVTTRTDDSLRTMDDGEWRTAQTITAVATAALVFLSLPVLFSLRLLFEATRDPRVLVVQRAILERITINEEWRTGWKQDLQATNERITAEVRSVLDSSTVQPLVITHYDADLDLGSN